MSLLLEVYAKAAKVAGASREELVETTFIAAALRAGVALHIERWR
jgi:alkylhydroperoxidase/carboxymuconolactone decarboxylase family protein YurZ